MQRRTHAAPHRSVMRATLLHIHCTHTVQCPAVHALSLPLHVIAPHVIMSSRPMSSRPTHSMSSRPTHSTAGIMSTTVSQRLGSMGGLTSATAPAGRVVVERRWRLGLPCRGHPSAIMQELFVLFKAHSVAWKKHTPYNLKCRALVAVQGMPGLLGLCDLLFITHISTHYIIVYIQL